MAGIAHQSAETEGPFRVFHQRILANGWGDEPIGDAASRPARDQAGLTAATKPATATTLIAEIGPLNRARLLLMLAAHPGGFPPWNV